MEETLNKYMFGSKEGREW